MSAVAAKEGQRTANQQYENVNTIKSPNTNTREQGLDNSDTKKRPQSQYENVGIVQRSKSEREYSNIPPKESDQNPAETRNSFSNP